MSNSKEAALQLQQALQNGSKKGICVSAPASNRWFIGKAIEFAWNSRLFGRILACGEGFSTSKLSNVEESDGIIAFKTESGSTYAFDFRTECASAHS